TLDGKHHDDREEKKHQRERAYLRNETLAIPGLALAPGESSPGGQTRDERDAEIDTDAFCDLADRDINGSAAQSEPSGNHRHEYERIKREEQHLKDRVERNQAGTIVRVAAGEIVPDDHHRDTSREADDDETGHILRTIAQENYREREHQDWTDYPVLNQREAEDFPVPKDVAQLVIVNLGQRRIHHQDQADRDW